MISELKRELARATQEGYAEFATIKSCNALLTAGVITLADLPTADPHVSGQLWNSTGTPTVSAG